MDPRTTPITGSTLATVTPPATELAAGDVLPGFLVSIDGPSGVGKTTCSKRLYDLLSQHGLPAIRTTQPSDSPIGVLARSGTHQFHGLALTCLVAADRYHHIASVIEPRLQAGHVVLCDRYVPSAFVLDRLDGASEEFITGLYRHARPADLAIFLLGEPEACLRRARARGGYSRFHHDHLAAAHHECALFAEVAERSRAAGTPTLIHHIGDDEADTVAAVLARHITAAITARAHPLLPHQR
ncbi:dTMP kinase [Streptosporangium canum]|uniref:dTMP kinase n=1 Tax=Streptosporangium canum TaxID=324952 RepID=UPI0036916F88